jgi:hypothetical protein
LIYTLEDFRASILCECKQIPITWVEAKGARGTEEELEEMGSLMCIYVLTCMVTRICKNAAQLAIAINHVGPEDENSMYWLTALP